jgi:hypothetical protein
MIETYGRQASKVFAYIAFDYVNRLSSESKAANARLTSFLERCATLQAPTDFIEGRQCDP